MLIDRYAKTFETEYHQFLLDPDCTHEVINGQFPEFPLAIFADETVRVQVGTRAGPVAVEVEVHDSSPQYNDAGWEDAAEGDLIYDREIGVAVWALWNGVFEQVIPADETQKLTPPGAHRYRVRIYARGKGIAWDGPVSGEPVEDYLVQMWPSATPQPARQTKHLSGL
ncbi:hypothetical protein [Nocardia fluminea]|uniref:hypothetical protein n=1 Tax=Nocardia fluminea TaxID=134984 RepID=UPI0036575A68